MYETTTLKNLSDETKFNSFFHFYFIRYVYSSNQQLTAFYPLPFFRDSLNGIASAYHLEWDLEGENNANTIEEVLLLSMLFGGEVRRLSLHRMCVQCGFENDAILFCSSITSVAQKAETENYDTIRGYFHLR